MMASSDSMMYVLPSLQYIKRLTCSIQRERLGRGAGAGQWLYFGSSLDAFAPDTQGLGPFCGHPNGGLVMKEILDPWPHWHTEDNELSLPDSHPMMSDPLFRNTSTQSWRFDLADRLAIMVLAGTEVW